MAVDSISRNTLAERTVGNFPISIATSQAIESLIGKLPEAPTADPHIGHIDLLMVNVRTLIRNVFGSLDKEARKRVDEYNVAETLVAEMRTIEQIVTEESDGRCQTMFYYCSYDDFLRKYTKSIPKTANTLLQKQNAAAEHTTAQYLLNDFRDQAPIEKYVTDFPNIDARTAIMTHYPIDLLQRYKFKSLVLLESHTGAIKPPMMWNTKLSDGRELEIIPFDRMSLQVFGDNVLFVPMGIKIRQRVYKIAKDRAWTPATTKDYVIYSIEQNRDPALEVLVKDLYRK